MEVRITPDQEVFIREALASGRLDCEEDAGEQAMLLWEDRERQRLEILAHVDKAEASLARGNGRVITNQEEAKELIDGIKRRGLARLSVDSKTAKE